MTTTLTYAPRLLTAPEAAQYLGVSQTTLRSLAIPRCHLLSKRLYDRIKLDDFASNLPTDEQDDETCTAADAAFG
jgi:hypothetical protein